MRQLVTVQKIKTISPIEGADKIELARILGWNVVVQKGQFKEGDFCVYAEIDTILPQSNPAFAFLEGKRIKTKKLRGVYSQGIAFPVFPILSDYIYPIREGVDVTDWLGAEKYEPQDDNKAKKPQAPKKWYMKFALGRWFYWHFIYKPVAKEFPSWIPKSDQTRVQILEDILKRYAGTPCSVAEKVDGSSITIWYDDKLHVCSRNREILDTEDVYFKTAKKYEDTIKLLPSKTVLQGELIGANIQGNKYKVNEYSIYFFSIIGRNGDFINPNEFYNICNSLKLPTVPRLNDILLPNTVDELVIMAEGESKLRKGVQREGIVIRPSDNIPIHGDKRFIEHRLSFKAINPKFLVKYDA